MNDVGATVLEVLQAEFSDLGNVAEAVRVASRLALAALLGALLGYDRERQGKPAGLRTYMLVAMGSAVVVMVPALAGMEMADLSRILQGVITGIGFLGAGAILKHHKKDEVSGLTTSAGVWMTAAIGMGCGLGRSMTAIVSALLAWLVLSMLPSTEMLRPDDDEHKKE